ncbi:MAG: hemolysin activation/secretion protein, partial [Lentimonas sp.]
MKNYSSTLFLILGLSIFTPSLSFAQNADAARRDIQIQNQILQEREELRRQREMEEIQRSRTKSLDALPTKTKKKIDDDGACAVIMGFDISGNENQKIEKITNPYLGECLSKSDFNQIKQDIENKYIHMGYTLARVYFDTTKISDQEISIIIEEGKIEDLQLQDNSKLNNRFPFRRKLSQFFAFGFKKDKVFNLRDIEQALDQMNRLSSNNATMDIIPSDSQEGYSKVIINNQISASTRPSFGISNTGSKSTGKTRYTANLNQDNLIGINDNIYYSHSRSNHDGVNNNKFHSNYLSFSAPFNYYTFGGSYSDSKYLTITRGNLSTSKASGLSRSISSYVSRVLSRSQKYKISLKGELNHASNKNYLNRTFQANNSRKLTVAKLSLDNVFYTKFGTIFLQPKYKRGTKLLGALEDSHDARSTTQKAQFNAYGLYGSISNRFPIPKSNINLSHNLTFDSQISMDRLFSSEQMSAGGNYTVRGFDESSILGDSGYYVRNDFGVNAYEIAPKFIRNSFTNKFLSRTNLGIFY